MSDEVVRDLDSDDRALDATRAALVHMARRLDVLTQGIAFLMVRALGGSAAPPREFFAQFGIEVSDAPHIWTPSDGAQRGRGN